jgi:hypothetical protein
MTDGAATGSLGPALLAAGPGAEYAAEFAFFGQFDGEWDIAWEGVADDGRRATGRGRLTFGWVLGGRAVQDVWQVELDPDADGTPRTGGFHGTTVRFYDPAIGAWRSTWIEPYHARVRRFIGRLDGDGILLLSDEDEPQLRWRFTDVTRDSFTWIGELSRDGGATWQHDETMHVTRRARGDAR